MDNEWPYMWNLILCWPDGVQRNFFVQDTAGTNDVMAAFQAGLGTLYPAGCQLMKYAPVNNDASIGTYVTVSTSCSPGGGSGGGGTGGGGTGGGGTGGGGTGGTQLSWILIVRWPDGTFHQYRVAGSSAAVAFASGLGSYYYAQATLEDYAGVQGDGTLGPYNSGGCWTGDGNVWGLEVQHCGSVGGGILGSISGTTLAMVAVGALLLFRKKG